MRSLRLSLSALAGKTVNGLPEVSGCPFAGNAGTLCGSHSSRSWRKGTKAMDVTITAKIDDDEIQGVDQGAIMAQLIYELGKYEFWTADSDGGIAFYDVKVSLKA